MKNGFFQSFRHAADGIWRTKRTERNFRVHIAAAAAAVTLGCFYGLDRTGWALLSLTAAFVTAAELFNTAVEHVCDLYTKQYNEKVKLAKDAAAGGVLLAAGGAAMVGLCLFGDAARLMQTVQSICADVKSILIVCAVAVFDALLLIFGEKNS